MNYVIRRWYDVGIPIAIASLIWMAVGDPTTIQVILLLNLVVLIWHQLEEMRWPGGSPWILNEVFNVQGGPPDRFPLNQANCALINIGGWVFYLAAVVFPDALWLGLATVLMGMAGQLIVHGVLINKKLKTWYNPGLGAVVFGHVPLGIWYLVEVYGQGVISGWDWLFAVLTLGVFAGFFMKYFSYTVLASRETRYPFEPWEMARWNRRERLTRADIEPMPVPQERREG